MSAAGAVPRLDARTRLLVLLGQPVEHSLSPAFQNAALRVLGLDAAYIALRCDAGSLPGLLRGVALAGGGGNVTLPHKALAAATVDHATEAVRATGACNTFWLEDGAVCGDNTDVTGVATAVERLCAAPATGMRVLLLGAGGAAAGALLALQTAGALEVAVLNRDVARAEALVARSQAPAAARVVPTVSALHGERFDLVVNATSLGVRADDPLPLAPERLGSVRFALDLVYAAGETAWVRGMRRAGVVAADGREMLLQQGVASFRRWWPGAGAPEAAMRAALGEALAG